MTQSRTIAQWDAPSTLVFLTLLVEHVEKNLGRLPKNPTYNKWVGILKASCDKDYDIPKLKSKYQRMRTDYFNTNVLKNHTGLRWNATLQRVVCSDEQWRDFVQVMFLHLSNT